ncbi:hypothetical protein SGQ83_00100 [Flavobacterium sp. Fl-318]|uniref:Uncharacterized protein n=1 Tax=Flavobacterium cupriresistens TaxID=2893885 RepID=A0ABU4R7G5_9FLAO|nr:MULTISPECIES: hypothetical protein [unclassified Flavobacterium]MDX6187738.1 hypothetical protein [Flavobacterium sp. Fl-318]UFH42339.1 hypothetical protein LNP23_21350 [Flavobacterium sp. F-323]
MIIDNMIKLQQRLNEPFKGMQDIKMLKNLKAAVKNELFTIYNKQPNKEEWLSREIISFNKKINILVGENKELNEIYYKADSRFDFVNNYLQESEYQFDLTVLMMEEFNKIKPDNYNKIVFFSFASYFISNLRKDDKIILLVEDLIMFYYSNPNPDLIDRTIVFELQGFIHARFADMELHEIKKRNNLIEKFILED